jgi:AraC-like DNA-binding protein
MDTFLDISIMNPEEQAKMDAALKKESEAQFRALADGESASGKPTYNEIYKCVLYQLEIKQAFLDPKLSLDKLSTVIGTNTTYLSNTINRFFGCNLRQLINGYRIRYACNLLESGEFDVHEVYGKSGFASQSVFYAAFAREMGISPLRYLATRSYALNVHKEVEEAFQKE